MTYVKVNFVAEFTAMMRYSRDNSLTSHERLLWIALFYIANDRAQMGENGEYGWPEGFMPVSIGELNMHTTFDKRAINNTRNMLKQRGLIDFQPGVGNKKNPSYRLNYLTVGCKNAPGNVPDTVPDSVPNSVPNNVPKNSGMGTKPGAKMSPYNININNNKYNHKNKTVSAQRYEQRIYSEEDLAGSSGSLMEEALEEARVVAN